MRTLLGWIGLRMQRFCHALASYSGDMFTERRMPSSLPVLLAPGGLGVSGLQENRWFQPVRPGAQTPGAVSASVLAAVSSPAPAPP